MGKPAVNLIYTQVISFGALGFAASAPGLPLVHGTQLSDLMTDNGQAKDALVLRHEMGPFAGLAHTSEIDPGLGDRLGDTPFCGNVDVQQLGCPDIDYLMFPYAIPNSPNIVSPLQTTVIQASPIYRGAVEPGGGFAEPLDQSEGTGADRAAPATNGRRVQREPGDAWKGRHGRALVRFADAHWCDHRAANRAAPDHLGLLRTVASDQELWALASDTAAPASVRARAMQAATRDEVNDMARATLATWASTPDEPRALRAAAIVALAKTGRPVPDVRDDATLARLIERLR